MRIYNLLILIVMAYVLAAPFTVHISMNLMETHWANVWTYVFWLFAWLFWVAFFIGVVVVWVSKK